MQSQLKLSIVCPFYNEENIIQAATTRMLANLKKYFSEDFELILVNDGSTDQSLNQLAAVAAQTQDSHLIRIISYPVNQGRGRALKTGINHAEGEIIVTTEVDCSWGDEIVHQLVQELKAHPEIDFVIASPHLPGGGLVNVPFKRVLLTKVGNFLIRMFLASNLTMNTGMTRAYRRSVIQPLVTYDNGKEFHLEVLLKLLTLGFKGTEIPASITWLKHKKTKSKQVAVRKSSTQIGKTIISHLRFIAIAQPVRYFALLALLSLVCGMGFITAAIWVLVTHRSPSVYLALMGLIMLLFCLLFSGFTVLFFQFREFMREKWAAYYPSPHPPSAKKGILILPAINSEN